MNLFGVKDWICDFLHSPCATTPTDYKILKPVYYTVCFFHKIICNVNNNSIPDTNLLKKEFSGKCSLTHYFSHVFRKICSSSCNITHLHVEIKSQPNDNSCHIADYFTVWFKDNTSILTEVSCTPINSERNNCYIDWCNIQDYTKFWLMELYKQWCYLVDCLFQRKMLLKPETGTILIEKGDSRIENWIRNWISQNLGIQWPKNVSFVQFVIYFCTVGGIFLFVLLVVRRHLKPKTDSKSLKLDDLDENVVQMLMDVLATNKSDYENLKKALEDNNIEYATTTKNLDKQINDFKNKINTMIKKHAIQQEATNNQASEMQQKCKKYEIQIIILNQQLSDLQKNHSDLRLANQKIYELEKLVEGLRTASQMYQDQKFTLDQQPPPEQHESTSTKIFHGGDNQDQAVEEAETQDDPHVIEAFKTIDAIWEDSQELMKQIEVFSGSEQDKTFLHINELLTRNTLKLDNIETNGLFVIRKKRKEVLQFIQNCRRILKSKVVI